MLLALVLYWIHVYQNQGSDLVFLPHLSDNSNARVFGYPGNSRAGNSI